MVLLLCRVLGRHLFLSDNGLVFIDLLSDGSVTYRVLRHLMDLRYEPTWLLLLHY